MFTITFKNVGQGDTIIIEWIDQGQNKIGIIDSHVYKYRNPALEHLKAHSYNKIEFYILTHLHYDHYSGISDVLNYCSQKKIVINTFFHTFSGSIVKIFAKEHSTIKAKAAKRLLDDFEKYVGRNHKIILNSIRLDNSRPNIKLNDSIDISILSPTDSDYFDLERSIGQYLKEAVTTKPNTNKVSTILKIKNNDEYILLTSDAMKTRISRIEGFLTPSKLILGQIPHHGSDKNHRVQFWENVNRIDNCIAVFSTGDEEADKIPDDITVIDIHRLKYKIHSTNQVNGICSVFGDPVVPLPSKVIIDDIFDLFASDYRQPNQLPLQDDLNGDQTFNLWKN